MVQSGGDPEGETFPGSHSPEERLLSPHFLDASRTAMSSWTRTFPNSPGPGPTTRTRTGMRLWKGDKNPESSPCRESQQTH